MFEFGTLVKPVKDEFLDFELEKRFRHFYVIGTTGTGKTTLLERMAKYDMEQGYSVIFIDPKGDNARRLYSVSNKEKSRFVSADHPIQMNPFRKPYDIDVIIDEFIEVLDILITATSSNPESSVRMKAMIKGAVKYFEGDELDLGFLFKFLSDVKTRDSIRGRFKLKEIDFFWSRVNKERDLLFTADNICARLSQLLFSDVFRPFILGDNEFDVQNYADEGKSLIVDLSQFGFDNRIFLTNLLAFSVYSYVLKGKHNKPIFLYIDEFQTTLSQSFISLLEQARFAKVGFSLAHQAFGGIRNKNLLDSILSITDNKAVLRCGYDEAEYLAKVFGVKYEKILNMDDYNAYVRIGKDVSHYELLPPFETDIFLPPVTLKDDYNFIKNKWIDII